MVLTLLLLLVALVIASSPGVESAPRDCAKLKQDTFKLLLSVKETCDEDFKDCCTISQLAKGANFLGQAKGNAIYDIQNPCSNGQQPFLSHAQSVTVLQARCDMDKQSGGWMVILRRKSDVSPLVNFNRTFAEYEHGFGDLNTEFWYGLKNIHCLTQRDDVELMIELKKNDGTGVTLTYQEFSVDGPETDYILNIRQGAGTGHQHISHNNGQAFTTFDRENDNWSGGNCGVRYGSGWWFYNNCGHTHPTNPHDGNGRSGDYFKPSWHDGSRWVVYTHIEMKVRPKSCRL